MQEEFLEYWLLFEGRRSDEVVSPKVSWDECKPTGELVTQLFELSRFLPERKPLQEPTYEAQAYLIGKLKDIRSTLGQLEEQAFARA